MTLRLGSRIVSGLVVLCFCVSAFALEPTLRAPANVKHLDQLIQKLGTGQNALVAVRLKDKSSASGYVSEAGEDYMILVNPKTGEQTTVPYAEVDRMQGYNIATGTEVHEHTGLRSKLVKFAVRGLPGHRIPKNSFAGGTVLIVGIIIGVILAIVLAKTL